MWGPQESSHCFACDFTDKGQEAHEIHTRVPNEYVHCVHKYPRPKSFSNSASNHETWPMLLQSPGFPTDVEWKPTNMGDILPDPSPPKQLVSQYGRGCPCWRRLLLCSFPSYPIHNNSLHHPVQLKLGAQVAPSPVSATSQQRSHLVTSEKKGH